MRFAKKMKGRLSHQERDGGSGSPTTSAGWYYSSLRPNSSGVLMDEVTALNLAAIWRAVTVKAGDLTKLPLNIYERLEAGGKRPDPANRIFELLSYPNEFQTGRKLRLAAYVHLILWGNSYIEIIRDRETGDPIRLELLDPRWVEPRRIDGRLVYWLKGKKSPWTGKTTLLAENVLHFSGISLNADSGLHPVQSMTEPLGIAAAIDKYAGTLWGNGAIINGVVECPPGWPDDARVNFRQSLQEEHGGVAMANRLCILEEGAKFVGNTFNPEQLQMLASRAYSVVEIARIVGIPPHKLYDMSHDIERGLEESSRDYYETDLEPICLGMADEIDLKLLTVEERKRYFAAFDMNSLMRPNALERAQANEIEMRNGVLTENEWRADLGRNPYTVDARLVPLNMVAISAETNPAPNPVDTPDDLEPTDPEPLPTGDAQ
jgi:HK97 family phage portal protein